MKNIKGLQHIGLPVKDMDKTIAFYRELGFTIAWETHNEGARVVFLQMGNLVLETYEKSPTAGVSGAWDHVSLDVVNIEEAWTEVVVKRSIPSLEGKIRFLPFWNNGVKFFTVEGPDGEKVEFNQYL